MKKSKIDNALLDCYRRLFSESEPSADFDVLMERATINEHGQKEIPFMDYEIDETVMDNIINNTIRDHKIPKHQQQAFKNTIYLGCSPKRKMK